MSTAKTRFTQQPIPARRIQPRNLSAPARPTSATPELREQALRTSRSFSTPQSESKAPAFDDMIASLSRCIEVEETLEPPSDGSNEATQLDSALQLNRPSSEGQLSAKERMAHTAKMQEHWKAQLPTRAETQKAPLKKKVRNAPPEQKAVEIAQSEEQVQKAPPKAEVLQDQQESGPLSPHERLLAAQSLAKAFDGSAYLAVTHTIRNDAQKTDQPALRRMLEDLDSSVTAFKTALDKSQTRGKRSAFKTTVTSWFRSTPKGLKRGIDEKNHDSLKYSAARIKHHADRLEEMLACLGLDTKALSDVSGKIGAAFNTAFPSLPDPI